jgi:hypothetical protein
MPGGGSQPGRSGSVLDGLSLPDTLRIKIVRIPRPVVVSPAMEPHAELAGRGGSTLRSPLSYSSWTCGHTSPTTDRQGQPCVVGDAD